MINKIESPQNEKFKYWVGLTTTKGLKKADEFLLSGEKIIREALKLQTVVVVCELHTQKQDSLVDGKRVQSYELKSELFKEIDIVGTDYNILVCKQKELPVWTNEVSCENLNVIAPLGDPNNLGALIRSAYALGAESVILTQEACHPYHSKVIKASAGASLRMKLLKGPSLKEIQVPALIELHTKGQSLDQFKWPKNCFLVVGEEGPGTPELANSTKISIPMSRTLESLNATVAASLAIDSYRRKG